MLMKPWRSTDWASDGLYWKNDFYEFIKTYQFNTTATAIFRHVVKQMLDNS